MQRAAHATPRNARRSTISVASIGFNLSDSEPAGETAERQAEALHKAAASLLVYQSVLRGAPAQAFLKILVHLQKGSSLKLLEHYGELYKALAADGAASWADHLIDQALRGADNPFARAAAKLEPTAHLLPAAQHDLDVLQSLAVAEATLARWVQEAAGASDTWAAAAASLATARPEVDGGVEVEAEGEGEGQDPCPEEPPAVVRRPRAPAARAALRAEIAGEWRWSGAAGRLQRYHAVHDFGLVSMHGALAWTGTNLQAHDEMKGGGGGSSDAGRCCSTALLLLRASHA